MSEEKKVPYGLGRRKTAIAQAQLLKGSKTRTINKKEFEDYFPTIDLQQIAKNALDVTSQEEEYGFQVKLRGGGPKSQAEAVKLAIARALVEADPAFHKQLKDVGALTRDPRVKERKKPGLKRARRAPQFSKR